MSSDPNLRDCVLLKITLLNRQNTKALSRNASARLHYNLRRDFKNPDTGRTSKCPPRDSVVFDAHFCIPEGAAPTTDASSAASWFAHTDAKDARVNNCTGRDFIIVHPLGFSPDQHKALSRDITQTIAAHLNTPTHGALHCRPGIFTPITSNPLGSKKVELTANAKAPPKHPNPHTHATTADRDVHGKKLREWGEKNESYKLIKALRLKLGKVLNKHLKMAGLPPRYAVEPIPKTHANLVSNRMFYVRKSWQDKNNRITERAHEIVNDLAPLAWLQEMRSLLTRGRKRNPTPEELRRLSLAKKASALADSKGKNFHTGIIGHLYRLSMDPHLLHAIAEPAGPADLRPRL